MVSSSGSSNSTSARRRRPRPASPARPLPLRARRRGAARPRLLREAYNIQVSGLEQRLRAIAGGSAGKPSTRSARPRSSSASPAASTPPTRSSSLPRRATASACRAPTSWLHDARLRDEQGTEVQRDHLMESLAITWEELDIRPAAAQMLTDLGHPPARARRSTTSPSRTSRPACAPTSSSAPPISAAASSLGPATCPSWRSAGAPMASATRCRTTASTPASPRPSCST